MHTAKQETFHHRKRLLIITYYWVPSGGAGVQRWVKFVKYLRDFGWEPIVYIPENPEYPSEDLSFQKDIPEHIEIIKTKIWEPYDVYRKIFGKKGEKINAGFISEKKKSGRKEKLSIWIRGNFLIPDPRRFWIKPSVDYLKKYLENNPVDAMVTTGPPHSMHMIGLGVKKSYPNLPWIADFRDPWTNIDFYKELNLTKIADHIHRKLERRVVQTADCITVVSNEMVKEYQALQAQRVELLTNGYDKEDLPKTVEPLSVKFTLSHIGTLNVARNPLILWKVLARLIDEYPEMKNDLEIKLIGKTDYSVVASIREFGLEENLAKIDYLSHCEAIVEQQSAQVLLLLINNSPNAKGILTGKFFEYLAAKRPILAIGPTDGDVANVLQNTSAGTIVDFNDEETLSKVVWKYYQQFKEKKIITTSFGIERYSRKELTKQLAEILNNML